MIQITTIRTGLHVVAFTVNDLNEVHVALGWTKWGAERKLIKALSKTSG